MPLFQYKALQSDGAVAEGELEAGGRQEAFRQLEGRSLRPIKLAERNGNGAKPALGAPKKSPPPAPKPPAPKPLAKEAPAEAKAAASLLARKISFGGGNKISARMLENFTRLLSSLLAAGVPLSRALVILTKEAASPAAAAKWKEVHDRVVDGLALAEAMNRSPETFPRV